MATEPRTGRERAIAWSCVRVVVENIYWWVERREHAAHTGKEA